MSIQQIQVAADILQDRLLLRVSTTTHDEVRVFLTRRFLRELWPHLARELVLHDAVPSPQAAQAVADPPPPPDFSQPFKNEQATFPLGSTPLLASEAAMEALSDGSRRLTFREQNERSFALSMNADLMASLCSMLRAGNQRLQWDLPLDYSQLPPTEPPVKAPAKRLLH